MWPQELRSRIKTDRDHQPACLRTPSQVSASPQCLRKDYSRAQFQSPDLKSKKCPKGTNFQNRPSNLYLFIYLFIYLWLCWVFVSVRGLSPVAASGGHSSSQCAGLSLSRPLLLRSTGSRRAGSVTVAHGPSCSAACGILPDQGSNPCPLHWQADSQPLLHQGSPRPSNLDVSLRNSVTCHLETMYYSASSASSEGLHGGGNPHSPLP